MREIEKGNIILIQVNDTEPTMAIIPKLNFQDCKITDILRKIHKLTEQFPNCNFNNSSILYENKYDLYSKKHNNISLSKWFQHYNIQKDEYNNYIFYITPFRSEGKRRKNTNKKKRKIKSKKNLRKSKKI